MIFAISPVIKKVFVLLSCTFFGLSCGTLYLYSSYSPQLAKQLHYTVSDSSTIALVGNFGASVSGPLAGLVVDRKGYSTSLSIGGTFIAFGYFGLKQQFDNEYNNVHLSALLLLLVGSGSTFINYACLKCCAISFPSIRGVATSLPLSLYGLSALFYSVIASLFFPGDTSSFLGFLAYSSIVIFAICAPAIMLCDVEHNPRRSNLLNKSQPDQHHHRNREMRSPSPELTNITGIRLFNSYKFWLIFFTTGSLASLGQMYIYSVGYMVKALISFKLLGLEINNDIIIQRDQQYQVGLISIANCIGRILSGILGDIITQSFGKPRSLLLFFPTVGLFITQLLGLNIQNDSVLPFESFFTGLFYGFIFCIMPIIVGDSFGMENYSSNWGIVSLAPILPSIYFTSLFGKIYDSNSTLDPINKGLKCELGYHCYNSIFSLTIIVSIISIVVVTLLNFDNEIPDFFVVMKSKISSNPTLPIAHDMKEKDSNEKVN
ncbi:major facilitator superfamily domain-containing protein [Scheffersomyces coipomensis]|uniref:major facilitator superfamily domain-containing protein n=1 Tax=Scheffersomyces coipomensis TaxID=1788519 RepID=UPI00315D8948